MARRAAFFAPAGPAVTVATGIPGGICTMESRESSPLNGGDATGIPMTGSIAGIVGISVLYLTLALALGLFISTITQRQITALLCSAMLMLIPLIMLSGMVFPIENMPGILRGLSCIIPARWYIDAIRKLMIEGLPFAAVLDDFAILAAMTAVLIGVALKKFKDRLE